MCFLLLALCHFVPWTDPACLTACLPACLSFVCAPAKMPVWQSLPVHCFPHFKRPLRCQCVCVHACSLPLSPAVPACISLPSCVSVCVCDGQLSALYAAVGVSACCSSQLCCSYRKTWKLELDQEPMHFIRWCQVFRELVDNNIQGNTTLGQSGQLDCSGMRICYIAETPVLRVFDLIHSTTCDWLLYDYSQLAKSSLLTKATVSLIGLTKVAN